MLGNEFRVKRRCVDCGVGLPRQHNKPNNSGRCRSCWMRVHVKIIAYSRRHKVSYKEARKRLDF